MILSLKFHNAMWRTVNVCYRVVIFLTSQLDNSLWANEKQPKEANVWNSNNLNWINVIKRKTLWHR